MTRDEWAGLAYLIGHWWPADFGDAAEDAYYVALGDLDADSVSDALRTLLRRGVRFRPSAAEIRGTIERDNATPTWEEARVAIWGVGGAGGLLARHRDDDALRTAARAVHPTLAAFAAMYGRAALAESPIYDPEQGRWELKRFAEAWERLVEVAELRRTKGLPEIVAGPARGELRRLRPTSALGVGDG